MVGSVKPMVVDRARARRWATAWALAFLMVAVVFLAAPPAAARPAAGGSSPASVFASISGPTAVAATPGGLFALTSSCTSVYAISATGKVTTFATLATSLNKCAGSALAVSPGLGNFPAGEVFVLQAGSLYEIPATGSTTPIAAALTLSNFTGGYMGLTFDYTGSFGYALIATGGKSGYVDSIDAGNQVQYLGTYGVPVEGLSVAPSSFGTAGGYLMAAQVSKSTVYSMSPGGAVGSFARWTNAEVVSFVPKLACSFSTTGDPYFIADTSSNSILAVPGSTFSSVTGSGLVLGASRGVGVGTMSSSGSTSSLFTVSGTLGGASYVTCPVGVTQKIDLSSQKLNGTDLNLIGFDPASRELVGVDPTNAPSEVFLLNGSTGAFVQKVAVGLDPTAVAFDGKQGALIVANSGSSNLSMLNATNYQELGHLSTGTGSAPVGVAFNPQNQKLYVASDGTNSLTVFSLANNLFPNQNQVTQLGGAPVALVVDPYDTNVYVLGNVQGTGTVWEFHAFSQVASLSLASQASSISVNNGTGTLYVTVPGSNELTLVAAGDTLASSISISDPVGAVFDPQNGLVFVLQGNGDLSIVQGSSVIDTYLFGSNPGPIVFDPVSNLAYGAADVTVSGVDPRIIIGGSG